MKILKLSFKKRYIIKNVNIEDGVWISSNFVIVGGLRIGKGAIIGAGSVVTNDFISMAVSLCVPA